MAALDPPLKLSVEPDDYLCTWLLPDRDGEMREYPGSLTLRADHPPTGVVHGGLPLQWELGSNGGSSADFPQRRVMAQVTAHLANGKDADLADVTVSYWFPGLGQVTAASAAIGLPHPHRDRELPGDDPADGPPKGTDAASVHTRYFSVKTQVQALDAVAGVAPFNEWRFPHGEDTRHLEGEWVIRGNPDSSQEWIDDGVTVNLDYDAAVGVGNPYFFRFAVSPVVRIEAREALTVHEWVTQWIDPLRKLVSLATGTPQSITYLSVTRERRDPSAPRQRARHQVYGTAITQQPYQSESGTVQKTGTALFLAEDGVSLIGMLRTWHLLEEQHHPLVETYGGMMSAHNEHPRSRFLLLVQALEGYYGHASAVAYKTRQDDHTATRDLILSVLAGCASLSPKERKFIKENLAKRPLRGLDEALRTLLAQLPVDLTPALQASPLLSEYLMQAQGPPRHRVAWAISRVRNDLAHGNRGFPARGLEGVVEVLDRMVRAFAMRLLGCPDTVLVRICTPGR